MKMNFFITNVFWGILLVLWGVSLILKGLNIVDLPLVKIFVAIVIIMFGVRLLFGGRCSHNVKHSHRVVHSSGSHEHTTVFGSQLVDLTNIDPNSDPIEVNSVFGSTIVHLPSDIDFKIESSAVFGPVVIPAKPITNKPSLGTVEIDANAVFGKVVFIYKNPVRKGSDAAPADSSQGEPSE
jgi:predicted membrane protein